MSSLLINNNGINNGIVDILRDFCGHLWGLRFHFLDWNEKQLFTHRTTFSCLFKDNYNLAGKRKKRGGASRDDSRLTRLLKEPRDTEDGLDSLTCRDRSWKLSILPVKVLYTYNDTKGPETTPFIPYCLLRTIDGSSWHKSRLFCWSIKLIGTGTQPYEASCVA